VEIIYGSMLEGVGPFFFEERSGDLPLSGNSPIKQLRPSEAKVSDLLPF